MPRTITPIVELGLGGSFIAQALATTTHYKFWQMKTINGDLSVEQRFNVSDSYPTGWSNGDTLSLVNTPLVNQPSTLPEGGRAVTLNGSNEYMTSVYNESSDADDIGPQSLECVVEIHALPTSTQEPAVMGGSSEFAITATSSGLIRGWYNGSAVCDLPFTINTPLHIVLTRTDASPDAVTLWVNGASDSATPSNGTINRGWLHLGKHWTNAHYLNATYSFAGIYAVAMTSNQVAAHYAAGIWTDVTTDVLTTDPIVIERGIKDDSPVARVAATGTASLSLRNFQKGNQIATLGRYTPGHVNCRAGFTKGIPVRVSMDVAGTDYVQFVGRVRRIAPEPHRYGSRRVNIVATDWLDEAARFRLSGAAIMEDVRADQVVAAIVERMPNQPHGITLHAGTETYELALDNTRDEAVPALAEFVRLQSSEVGRLFVTREGALVCESRSTRPTDHSSVALDIGDDMVELDAAETTDAVINRVEVTVHPRRVDDDFVVLYRIDRPIELESLVPQTFTGTYVNLQGESPERVGGLNMQVPSISDGHNDYAAFEFDDASGQDVTSSVRVSVSLGANSVEITLINTNTSNLPTSGSPTIHLTSFQVRGRGVYDFAPQIVFAQDDEAIASDGLNVVSFDMPYQEEPAVGQEIADALLAAYQFAGTRARSQRLCANDDSLPADLLARDISDRVSLDEYMTAVDGEYHINGVRIEHANEAACFVQYWLGVPEAA